MKRNPKRVWRSVISVVLALTLVLGMAATSFASVTKVSLNDVASREEIADKVQELYDEAKGYIDIEELNQILDGAITPEVIEQLDKAVADLKADLVNEESELNATIAEIEKYLNELNEELNALYNQIQDDLEDPDSELSKKIEAVKADIKAVEDRLAEIEAQKDDLWNAACEAEAAISEMMEIVTTGEGDMAASIDKLIDAIETVGEIVYEVEDITAALVDAIEGAVAAAEDLNAKVEAIIAEIEAIYEEVTAEVEAIIAEIEATVAEIEAAVEEGIATIEAIVNDAIAAVEKAIEEIEAAIDEAIAYVEAKIEAATTCDYEVTEDSYLVGMGDFSAASYDEDTASYVEALAKKLGIDYNSDLCGAMTPEMLIELIAEDENAAAEIKAADLITIGFGNAQIMENAVWSETEYTDWAKYVGAENEKYVDEALAEIEAYLAENGIEGEAADILLNLIDGYAYAYTELACGYPELINEVKAINPDAQIIIVGMHNPLTGFVVDVDGTEVPVGEYVDYIIAASNAHYFGYSLITGNAIYVDAPAVETKAAEMTIDELLDAIAEEEGFTVFNPTAAGHEYIAEQIMGAINVVKPEVAGLWGDADSNGEVNVFDAQLILEWIVKNVSDDEIALNVCDVDASGTVDVFDAQMILERVVGNNTVFPAEK